VASDIRLEHLTKTFGPRRVLDDVGFTIPRGGVVGLLGHNGSGKSTLIKILTGYHRPDHGSNAAAVIGGARVALPAHADDQRFQVAAVHQDLALQPSASVAENLLVDRLGTGRLHLLRWRRVHERAAEILSRGGAKGIDTRRLVSDLRPVERAQLAIARAVDTLRGSDHGLLILDEVTAFLPQDAVQQVFELIKGLCAQGLSVLFVSHRMEEVRAICDRAVVLRNGEMVADRALSDISEQELIMHIVGSTVDWLYPEKHPAQDAVTAQVRLEAASGLGAVSFDARVGEIVGLTGLKGMGHDELIYALFGERARASGTLTVGGHALELSRMTPRRAATHGIRLVPADRLRQGAVGWASVRENASLPHLETFFRGGRLRQRAEREWAQAIVLSYGVVPDDAEVPYKTLSGGNQQKVLLARWLETKPTLLLLDEPTQGVDVGVRREIFRRLVAAAQAGMTILYSTTEAQDLAELCHRVLVFRDGAVVGELEGETVTEDNISRMCWSTGADDLLREVEAV
jgi:ribose transport system ATP-binding protein